MEITPVEGEQSVGPGHQGEQRMKPLQESMVAAKPKPKPESQMTCVHAWLVQTLSQRSSPPHLSFTDEGTKAHRYMVHWVVRGRARNRN